MRELSGGQQGDKWHMHRLGRVTASRMKDLMAYSKRDKGALKARGDYMWELLAERMTGVEQKNRPPTPAMQWGIDQEPFAVQMFEQTSDQFVLPVGFVLHPTFDFAGASPDGLIENSSLEVKCPESTTYLRWRLAGGVPQEHRDQMQWQMLCTGRANGIFIGYDPRQKEGCRIFFRDLPRDDVRIAELEAEAVKINAEIESAIAALGLPPTEWLIEEGELAQAKPTKSRFRQQLEDSLSAQEAMEAAADYIDRVTEIMP